MKRSEMLKTIIDLYYDLTVNCECPEKYSSGSGEAILEAIEEAGMLPPGMYTGEYDNNGNQLDITEWEKE